MQSSKQLQRIAKGTVLTYENVHSNVNITLRSRSPHHISLLFCYYPRLPHTIVSSDPLVLALSSSDVSNEYSGSELSFIICLKLIIYCI